MSSINSIVALNEVAEFHVLIRSILEDDTLGRKKAAEKIWSSHGVWVSDKLVRTWRENNNANKAINEYPSFTMTLTDAHTGNNVNPITVKSGKARSSKTIVVMPDLQAPLHDQPLVDKFVKFLGDFQPTELAQVGDFTDSTEISRWVRGKKPEYSGDLAAGFRKARIVVSDIRDVFAGRWRIVRSNHDDRLENYINAFAPGLASFMDDGEQFNFEGLMKFNQFDVEFVRDGVVELNEDWIMAHGDEGSLSPQAGKTAFGLAKNKFGTNVVCGHTHRAGITTESYGYNGSIKRVLSGLEVGHFMDMNVADYLKKSGGHANWQQAFGILETINGKTFPSLIPVHDGNFIFEGEMY